jgi:hypothetical protein
VTGASVLETARFDQFTNLIRHRLIELARLDRPQLERHRRCDEVKQRRTATAGGPNW